MKIIWFDTETTGLDSKENDIISLSGYLEIDRKIVETFDYKMKPFNMKNISKEALDVNGFTLEQLESFPSPLVAKKDLEKRVKKYINPFKKNKSLNDRFVPAGQNVKFDTGFLEQLWTKCGDKWYGSLFSYQSLDLLSLTQIMRLKGILKTENLKLETMANHFGVKILAHDAQSDINATREIFYKIYDSITFGENNAKENL